MKKAKKKAKAKDKYYMVSISLTEYDELYIKAKNKAEAINVAEVIAEKVLGLGSDVDHCELIDKETFKESADSFNSNKDEDLE